MKLFFKNSLSIKTISQLQNMKFNLLLKNYVNNMELSDEISNNIKRGIKTYGDEISGTFYRGQSSHSIGIHSKYWFSTSSSYKVAKDMFAGVDGIVYIIHVVNAYAISVNDILTREDIGQNEEENEMIIEGGGKFYNSELCSSEGFHKINDNLYETWYTIEGETIEGEMIKGEIIEGETIEEIIKKTNAIEETEFDVNVFCENNIDELEMIDSLEEFRLVFTEFADCSDEFVQKIYILSKKH
jgi:hypothetical protein